MFLEPNPIKDIPIKMFDLVGSLAVECMEESGKPEQHNKVHWFQASMIFQIILVTIADMELRVTKEETKREWTKRQQAAMDILRVTSNWTETVDIDLEKLMAPVASNEKSLEIVRRLVPLDYRHLFDTYMKKVVSNWDSIGGDVEC